MKELYQTYSAYQLAGEESFIAWVMHGENGGMWERWLEVHKDKTTVVQEAKQIVLDLAALPEHNLSSGDQEKLWNSISSGISVAPKTNTKNRITVLRWSALAAAAAIALLFWISTRNQITTVLAAAGEHKEIQLPESSHIQLNADSRIGYSAKHFTQDRELTLEGEAFFKVHPGSRFTVKTSEGSVTVVGTSFNVLARKGQFEVKCFTGKVKVVNTHQDEHLLTPGEQCRNDEASNQLTAYVFTMTSDTPDWTHGKFVFEDQPLYLVIEELERQYNIKVNLAPDLNNIHYSGFFETGDLDKALKFITWPLTLKAVNNGNTVEIGR